jgi:hypothetical protein
VEQVLVSDIMVEFPELQSEENKQVREQIVASGVLNIHKTIKSDTLKGTANLLYLHTKLLEKEPKNKTS